MPLLFKMTNYDMRVFKKNWGWILAWGIVLGILGCLAISAAVFTTLISIIFLGGVLFASGLIMTINTFQYWLQKPGFWSHLIVSLLYIAAGIVLMFTPIPAAYSITILLAIFFIIIGLFRLITAAAFQLPSWGWSFLSGIITLLLGIFILAQLPASGFYIIGLFVGIDLLIAGWAFIMLALLAKNSQM
ncbi:MAG: DUF308 domain-containing protein [Proteobacteria bacterium]|nr:DUF308 domain-containing protein [Pseudomonadota bacterium]